MTAFQLCTDDLVTIRTDKQNTFIYLKAFFGEFMFFEYYSHGLCYIIPERHLYSGNFSLTITLLMKSVFGYKITYVYQIFGFPRSHIENVVKHAVIIGSTKNSNSRSVCKNIDIRHFKSVKVSFHKYFFLFPNKALDGFFGSLRVS